MTPERWVELRRQINRWLPDWPRVTRFGSMAAHDEQQAREHGYWRLEDGPLGDNSRFLHERHIAQTLKAAEASAAAHARRKEQDRLRRARERFEQWAASRVQRARGPAAWRVARSLELDVGLPRPLQALVWVATPSLAEVYRTADIDAMAAAIDAVDAQHTGGAVAEHAQRLVLRAAARTAEPREFELLAQHWETAAYPARPLAQLLALLDDGFERWQEGLAERTRIRELSSELHLSGYPELFAAARAASRRFRILVGPPNSGKTHAAMNRLAAAESGCYLAPLRLLALEGQEALAARGVAASLITGEERDLIEGSRHVAATVEMLDLERRVEVAVIDEFQMLFDRDRGWAWTQAIVGAPASEVVLVGAAYALPALERLLAVLGEPYEIERFERKAPLVLDTERMVPIEQLRAGDALIAFSRRDVLRYKDELERRGKHVAVVYGALSPEVRRREAERFRSGDAQVLVATDAIGMGLNLPIARIVFSTVAKWDGIEERLLEPSEFHQIAGRAGRFGMYEEGRVALLAGASPGWKALDKLFWQAPAAPQSTRLTVAPAWMHVGRIAQALGTDDLATVLAVFTERLSLSDALFKPAQLSDMRALAADTVPQHGLSMRERFVYAQSPASERPEEVRAALAWWASAHAHGEPARLESLPARFRHAAQSSDFLAEAETRLKCVTLYAWLAWRFPKFYPDAERARRHSMQLDAYIEQALRLGAARQRTERSGAARSPHGARRDRGFRRRRGPDSPRWHAR